MNASHAESYLRLRNVIGDSKANIPPIIPVGKTTWYELCRKGIAPPGIRLPGCRATVWRASDVFAFAEQAANDDRQPQASPATHQRGAPGHRYGRV